MIEGQCPNCAGDLVEGLCSCGHDGNRADCSCEYCSTPPTADLPDGEVVMADTNPMKLMNKYGSVPEMARDLDTQYRKWLGQDLWDGE